jgi:hypothetical protein
MLKNRKNPAPSSRQLVAVRQFFWTRLFAWLNRWEQILGMRNGEPQVYTLVHEDSSTANDNEDAPSIESCKKSIDFVDFAML